MTGCCEHAGTGLAGGLLSGPRRESTDTHTNIALSCGNSLGTHKNVIRHSLRVEEFHTFSSGRYSQNFILNWNHKANPSRFIATCKTILSPSVKKWLLVCESLRVNFPILYFQIAIRILNVEKYSHVVGESVLLNLKNYLKTNWPSAVNHSLSHHPLYNQPLVYCRKWRRGKGPHFVCW